MREDKCKKLTKQEIVEERIAARRRNYYATTKWTAEVARRAQQDMLQRAHDRHVAFLQRVERTGRVLQYEGDTSTSSDSDNVAMVCESPEKKVSQYVPSCSLEEKETERAKKRFFPFSKTSSAPVQHEVLAPDTMELGVSVDNLNSEGNIFNYVCHKFVLLMSQV